MKCCIEKTICIYAKKQYVDFIVSNIILTESKEFYYAESETDLLGVPYFAAIVDINNLTFFFSFIKMLKPNTIHIISYTQPKTRIARKHKNYFEIIDFKECKLTL